MAPNEVPLANYAKARKMLLKCIRNQGIGKGIVGPLLKRMNFFFFKDMWKAEKLSTYFVLALH